MAVSDYDPIIEAAAKEWNVDPDLARSVMLQESGGSPVDKNGRPLRSSAGAASLMQLMPGTASSLGVQHIDDPVENIWGGVKNLSQLLTRFNGSVPAAVAGYNANPDTVQAWLDGKGQLPSETQKYIPAVAANYQRLQAQRAQAGPAQASAPSDDDFLKHVGAPAAPAATAVPSDADFLTSLGVKPPAASSAGTPAPVNGVYDEYGNPNPPSARNPPPPAPPRPIVASDAAASAPDRSGPGLLSIPEAMASGAARGFGSVTADNPIGISPQQEQTLRSWGIYGPQTGAGTPVQRLNEAVINPLAATGGLISRLGGAALGAYQGGVSQAGEVAGNPLLGRDLAALPEAFPTGVEGGANALHNAPNALTYVGNKLIGDDQAIARPMTRPSALAPDASPGGTVANPLVAANTNTGPPALRPAGSWTTTDPLTGEAVPLPPSGNPLESPVSPTREAAQPAQSTGAPRTSAEAKKIASAFYDRADTAGGQLTPSFTDAFLDKVKSLAPQTPEGIAVAGESPITQLGARLESLRGKPISLQGAQEVSEGLGNLIDKEWSPKGLTKDGKDLLDLQSTFRDSISNAGPGDLVGGSDGFGAWKQGQQAWAQAQKMGDLERIQTRAALSDNPATTVKSGIRTLMSNPTRVRGYSPDEIQALQAAGDRGVLGSALHVFGNRLIPAAAGLAGFGSDGILSGMAAAGVTQGLTTVSRNLAGRLQAGRLQSAMDILGSKVPTP